MRASWAAYHASNREHEEERPTDISSLLPLFPDKANSVAMIRHAMNLVKQNVEFLNPGQIPVLHWQNRSNGIGLPPMEKIKRLEVST